MLLLLTLPTDATGTLCPFHWLTGIPCPACGLLRSMSSLLLLDLFGSLRFHPLGSLILGLLGLVLVSNSWSMPLEPGEGPSGPASYGFSRALLFLFLFIWVMRLGGLFPFWFE